jgi:HK97 family phage portal protein
MKRKPGIIGRLVRAIADSIRVAYEESLYGYSSASGAVVSLESAMRISTVNACVRIIAQTVGSLPLHIYKRLDTGGRERWGAHPLAWLLNSRPNSWQTAMEWREELMAHLLLRGNAYAVIIRNASGFISDLIPINPDRVIEVLQRSDYGIEYHIRRANGSIVTLGQADVLHIRGLSTDGIVGRSVISDARDLFGSALSTTEYGARLFRNDATPGIILKSPKALSDAAYARLQESWNARHAGAENAGKTAILEDGVDATRLSMSANDAQFLQTIQAQRSQIAGWFGVPLILLSFNENTQTYASAEQFMLSFVQHTIRPWLVRLEQAIKVQLFLAPGLYYPEFSIEGILRGDLKSRYEAYAQGISWGWLSPNEVRERENMNAREGGDVFLEPANMRPSGSLTQGGNQNAG